VPPKGFQGEEYGSREGQRRALGGGLLLKFHKPRHLLTWNLGGLNSGVISLQLSSWGKAVPWGANPVKRGDKGPK
jgi:hypothetical protein